MTPAFCFRHGILNQLIMNNKNIVEEICHYRKNTLTTEQQ